MASPPTPPRRSAGTPAGRPGSPAAASCPACGAPLAADQRYCVECGARRGPLPAIVCEAIGAATHAHAREAGRDEEGRERVGGEGVGREAPAEALPLPTPRAAAVAVMALLAFGVLIGSSIAPVALSGANAPRLLALVRPAPAKAKAPPPVSETPTPPPATEEAAAPTPAPVTETVSQSTTKTKQPAAGKGEGEGASSPGAGTLPPIGHVFLIVLSDQGETAAFGPNSPAPYISKNLPAEGELLENYSAVAGGELANEIALISGQGPTPQTLENCPLYSDIAPGTTGSEGQVLGSGCVYPRQTLTLANQLTDAGKTWKAYVGGIEAGGPGQPVSCRHPTPGAADPDNAPSPGDAYVTWRNPFVYFHSIIDNTVCTQDDVGLPQLGSDLKDARSTPSLAYIVPDRCEDGSETPCAPGAPDGLAAAETFLRKVVPEIQASAAYREGGLIAITFDQAPQTGPGADSSGCCTLAPYPNLPAASTTTSTTTTSAASSAPAETTTTSAAVPASASTVPSSTVGTPETSTPGASTTQAAAPTGGGRVGLLLLSKYVKPGTLNVTGEYNHFALLRSIENLFGLQPLGYAGAEGLLAFDSSVFNAHA